MTYKFFWADGKIDYSPSTTIEHTELWLRILKTLPPNHRFSENYVAGYYYPDQNEKIIITWHQGITPNENELRFLLKQQMERFDRKSSLDLPPIFSANVEDTEPEYNFGFLNDPHKELYPAAFDGMKMRHETVEKIKSYVLQAVQVGTEANADAWIYFTVYGSGASYNWDETGDFDVQMWVDIDGYNEHHINDPLTSDELLSMVRRAVQSVNFPSFAELGLNTPDCEGKMLIQYYAKPGKGTKEENLASKPYACYDMETSVWLQRPEPFTPEFYGESFLRVENKSRDIADQADQLISQFQRNILSWQFWTQLFSKYRNKEYRKAADDAKTNATIEQQGVQTLFEGVFGGRQKAYSEEGEGYKDERDLTQKMLEVWGVFQKLKHYARVALPWDEQEMPKEAMAERSGDPQLDALIEEYLHENPQIEYELLEDFRYEPDRYDPAAVSGQDWWELNQDAWQNSTGKCMEVANHFAVWLNDKGIQADVGVGEVGEFGYSDRTEPGNPNDQTHAVTMIDKDGHTYAVDWSASQYGYSEFPMIQRLDDSGGWQRQWTSAALNITNERTAANEVDFDSYPSFTYNATEHEVYLGKDHPTIWESHPQWYSEDPSSFFNGWIGKINGHWVFTDYSADFSLESNEALRGKAQQALDEYFHGIRPYTHVWDDALKTSSLDKFATWTDLMEKAQRLRESTRDDGSPGVQIDLNAPDHVVGTVQGDHDIYDTEIWRDDPNSQAITMWDCSCDWSDFSWGRTRQWKKFEGRPCSHTLALFWEAQRTPVSDEATGETPPQPAPGGDMQPGEVSPGAIQPYDPSHLIEPFGSPEPAGPPIPVTGEPAPFNPGEMLPPAPMGPQEPATVSQPTRAGDPNAGPLGIPGAFSHVWKEAAEMPLRWIYDGTTGEVHIGKINQHHEDIEQEKDIKVNKDYLNSVTMGYYDPSNAKITIAHGTGDDDTVLEAVYGQLATEGYIDPLKLPRQKVIASTVDDLSIVGDQIREWALPDYGDLYWNPDEKTVYWVAADYTSSEEIDEARRLLFDVPGVDHVEIEAEVSPPGGWQKVAAFTNGQIVRCRIPLYGEEPTTGTPHIIPQNSAGEIIWSDGNEVAVIFPLASGPLGPHLIKVFCQEEDLYLDPKAQPFIWKKHHGNNSLWQEAVEIQD
jgi:hypothetical protein